MDAKEVGQPFLARTCEYLLSLPFDVKALQEAVADPDLDRAARELAAAVVVHTLHHLDGKDFERFLDSVFFVRLGFQEVLVRGGDGAAAFRARFPEIYDRLAEDVDVFRGALGEELWGWLGGRLGGGRLVLKGKRPAQYIEDEAALDELYEECIEFQTNFNVAEQQVRNRLRRPEQIVEVLQRRHTEDSRKRP